MIDSRVYFFFAGRLERAVRVQRARSEHISLRRPQRGHHCPLSISVMHPGDGGSSPSVRPIEGQRGVVGAPDLSGICGRKAGYQRPAQFALWLWFIHRTLRRILLRVCEPGNQRRCRWRQDGLRAHPSCHRYVEAKGALPINLKGPQNGKIFRWVGRL